MKMLFKSPISWWKFEGKYYHKDFIRGVKNLWKWLPVVWKDRDWDPSHIYKILQFKLEQQAYGIGSRDIHMNAQRDAELMLLCARLCYAQIEEGYENEYFEYVEKKYEFVPTDETQKWYTLEYETVEDNLDEYFALYPKQHKRVLEGKLDWHGHKPDLTNREEIARCIAWNNQERSRKLLFKILEERINNWWD
jgi:hypothetical protein